MCFCHTWSIIILTYLQGKTDSTKKTGTSGGKIIKLDEIDHEVLDMKVSTNILSGIILLNVPNLVTK
jgi:hypothetical protein